MSEIPQETVVFARVGDTFSTSERTEVLHKVRTPLEEMDGVFRKRGATRVAVPSEKEDDVGFLIVRAEVACREKSLYHLVLLDIPFSYFCSTDLRLTSWFNVTGTSFCEFSDAAIERIWCLIQ